MRDRMRRINRIHLVGIGGVGMGGIAEVLLNHGFTVQGSDLRESAVTRRLTRLGALVHQDERPQRARLRGGPHARALTGGEPSAGGGHRRDHRDGHLDTGAATEARQQADGGEWRGGDRDRRGGRAAGERGLSAAGHGAGECWSRY